MGRDVDREDARVCNRVCNKEEGSCFRGGASLLSFIISYPRDNRSYTFQSPP